MASEINAAQPGLVDTHADQSGTDEWENVLKPRPRGAADTPRYLAANDQPIGPQRPEQAAPAAQEPPADNPKSENPVGVAPETPPDTLPPSIFRVFDLPGAGVLTPKGTLVVEPYLQYAHLTNNRVTLTGFTIVPALTIGLINVQGFTRDIYTAALVGRYGLTNRLELEVRVPYLYRADSIATRPLATPSTADTVSTYTGSGLGDVETTLRYQINQGGAADPYFVGFARFKSTTGTGPFAVPTDPVTGFQTDLPTGSGFYILQPGLTFLLPSDPVVIFSSLSYIWNMPRDVGGQIGRIDPGSGANANVGLGISLNEKVSLSLGYDHTFFERPTANTNLLLTTTPSVTNVGVLLVGGSYRLSDRSFVNFSVGVGATREAPDLQVTIRIPTTVFSRN
ncbi:transporter [Nitrospira sp. NS4]|uniref:transporter n=1 Tax=Nitrospira sp. NS4 TaxID=3414498 RepID=UPI003C2F374A